MFAAEKADPALWQVSQLSIGIALAIGPGGPGGPTGPGAPGVPGVPGVPGCPSAPSLPSSPEQPPNAATEAMRPQIKRDCANLNGLILILLSLPRKTTRPRLPGGLDFPCVQHGKSHRGNYGPTCHESYRPRTEKTGLWLPIGIVDFRGLRCGDGAFSGQLAVFPMLARRLPLPGPAPAPYAGWTATVSLSRQR